MTNDICFAHPRVYGLARTGFFPSQMESFRSVAPTLQPNSFRDGRTWAIAVRNSVDVSIFFFSARGRGRGSPGRQKGAGSQFLLKIPGGGGVSHEGSGEGEGPGGCLQRIGGGGG